MNLVSALAQFQSALAERPDYPRTYTIYGFDKSPYITRTLMPRINGERMMLHQIHRPDQDRHLHNHPWATASFYILSGGYIEERLVDGLIVTTEYKPGDVNHLTANTFHRISSIEPDTYTLGMIGERVQDWGFLVDGIVFPHLEYFAQMGHTAERDAGRSGVSSFDTGSLE